jgi:hypothetical protein
MTPVQSLYKHTVTLNVIHDNPGIHSEPTSHGAVMPWNLLRTTTLRDGSVTDLPCPTPSPRWRLRRLRRRSGVVMQDSRGSSGLVVSVGIASTSPIARSTYVP